MIKALLDFLEFLSSNFAFLLSLAVYTILAIALSKSIKKHATTYYWVFAIISFAYLIPFLCRMGGIELPFNLGTVPFLGLAMNELSHAANFVHPVLILIMYMGAFSPKVKYVGRLMSIRKELSIIVGFPVIAHATKRLFASFPGGWQYFFNNEEYMQNPRVTSALGSGITSFVFVLGLVMFVLFLVLWVTSFDSVHRKLGAKRWKSVQKWSYGLYAMLFIHALGLQLGGLISDNAKEAQQAQQPKIELAEVKGNNEQHSHGEQSHVQHSHGEQSQPQQNVQGQPPQAQQGKSSHGHGPKNFSFADVKIPRATGRVISIFVLFAIYGSYLVLRLRKARKNREKRQKI